MGLAILDTVPCTNLFGQFQKFKTNFSVYTVSKDRTVNEKSIIKTAETIFMIK